MDRQAFKQRMQNLKSYRENNPGKGYWDWKVEAFADGGVNDNLVGSYSNHTGTPTMYVPVTKEYEAVPEGFGEIANVHTPELLLLRVILVLQKLQIKVVEMLLHMLAQLQPELLYQR